MVRRSRVVQLFAVKSIVFLFLAAGCTGFTVRGRSYAHTPPPRKSGPPAWAPAHGRRAKYSYCYYPSVSVYFDAQRRVYFYYEGGAWRSAASLPATIHLEADNYVTVELTTGKPYECHAQVAKKYPPGQRKKLTTRKIKGRKH